MQRALQSVRVGAAWFENDGKGNFTTHHIFEDQAAYDIRLVDMEADGDLDVLIAGQNSKNVVWYENRVRTKVGVPVTPIP